MEISTNTLNKMKSVAYLGLEKRMALYQAIRAKKPIYLVQLKDAKAGTIVRADNASASINGSHISISLGRGVIDGRKDDYWVSEYSMAWLEDYTGGTLWKFTRKAKVDAPKILDKTGEEVLVGDLVAASAGDRLYVGKIERRSDKGTIWIRELKLRDDQTLLSVAVKVGPVQRDQLIKLESAMLDRIMLAKLRG